MRLNVLIFLFIFIGLTAGEVQFDLSTYEPIAYKTVALSLFPQINSSYKDSFFNNMGSLTQNWLITKSSEIRFNEFSFMNNIFAGATKQREDSIPARRLTSLYGAHIISYQHRKYLKPYKFFFQSHSNILFAHNYSFVEGIGHNTNTHTLTPTQSLSIGFGRINDVTYPAVCLQAFRMLYKKGMLQKKAPEDIQLTSQLFERLKRKRIWDQREARIAQIKEITDYIYAKEITSSLNPEQLMQFLDIWQYGFSQERKHGHEFQFAAYAEFWDIIDEIKSSNERGYINNMNPEKYFTRESFVSLLAQFEIHRSPNLTHTRSLFFETMFGGSSSNSALLTCSFRPSISFYPTLRSTISLTNNSTFLSNNDYRHDNTNFNSSLFINTSNVTVEYFVRPQLSYTGKWDIEVTNNYLEDNPKHEFLFGMTYHIK